MMHRLILAFCMLLSFASASFAGSEPPKMLIKHKPVPMLYDSSEVTVRGFDTAKLEQFRKSPEFNYNNDAEGNRSWWDRFWAWLWHLIEKLFAGKKASGGSLPSYAKYVSLFIAICLAAFLIIKAMRLDYIFSRKPKGVALAYSESDDNIHEIDFDKAIEKAWNEGNYRVGVRLLYLQSLKELNDARLINWQNGKTNSTYLSELIDASQKHSFGVLTNCFEYIWYGNFPIDKQSYQRIHLLFSEFKKTLA